MLSIVSPRIKLHNIIIKGEHIILRNNKKIISDETEVANTLKNIFSNIKHLKIPGYYF